MAGKGRKLAFTWLIKLAVENCGLLPQHCEPNESGGCAKKQHCFVLYRPGRSQVINEECSKALPYLVKKKTAAANQPSPKLIAEAPFMENHLC